jgi:hypothetical protein
LHDVFVARATISVKTSVKVAAATAYTAIEPMMLLVVRVLSLLLLLENELCLLLMMEEPLLLTTMLNMLS